MKKATYSTKYIVGLAFSVMVLSSQSFAATGGVTPYYSSNQQADTGYASALHESDLMSGQLQEQMNAVMEAETHLSGMGSTGSSQQETVAANTLYSATASMVETMSRVTGVSQDEIEAMHEGGMSWGQVGQELGLNMNGRVSSVEGGSNSASEMGGGPRSESGQGSNQMMNTAVSGIHQGNASSEGGLTIAGAAGSMVNSGDESLQQQMANLSHDRLSPMPEGGLSSMANNQNQYMASNTVSSQQHMQNLDVSSDEMEAATDRNVMNGGVSGHGTGVNSGVNHEPGEMMTGAGGLSNGMPSDHGSNGGEQGGMGGNSGSGGMGGSGSGGMGGSGSGGMGGSGSGGMGGSGSGGMGGSGSGGMM